MENYNEIECSSVNEDGTRINIKYLHNGKLLNEVEAQCSLPQFICDFEGISKVDTQNEIIYYGKKLVAVFFTNENHFDTQISPFDFLLVKPSIPIKEDGFSDLYRDIFYRMKLWDDDKALHIIESERENYLKQMEKFKTDKSKKDFLVEFVLRMIQFELIRPKVNNFIKEYLEKNKEYKYVRIFSN